MSLDLEAIQGRVRDLPEGGRPLFFHEVIDMGGEAIKSSEYFSVGKVMEFRYGIKLAECIRNGDFNCLQGIYDQVPSNMTPIHSLWNLQGTSDSCQLLTVRILLLSH